MCYLDKDWDGVSPCVNKALPIWMKTQRQEKYISIKIKVANNMSKLFAKGYVMEGVILILTSFFYVPKVTEGIVKQFPAVNTVNMFR